MKITDAALEFLSRQIQPQQPLYAVVDAAQDSQAILSLLDYVHPKLNFANLFAGERAKELAPAAPYLIQFTSADHPLLAKLVHSGWQHNWSLYFSYPNGFEAAVNKLRRDMRVTDSDNMPRLFRFYDPKVFQKYLPLFDTQQLREFFGATSHYWIPDNLANNLLDYQLIEQKLAVNPIALDEYNHHPDTALIVKDKSKC